MPWTVNFEWFKYLASRWIKIQMTRLWSNKCIKLFGENAANIFKLFKLLFELQGPSVKFLSRKRAPNHKVEHLFSHIIQVSNEAFEPGCNISSDEQDEILQGHHEDKHRITFKHVGYGFFIDALCENGYTINFYARNPPPPKKWIEKGN